MLLTTCTLTTTWCAEPIEIGGRLEVFVDDHLIGEVKGDVSQQLLRPAPKEVVFVAGEPWEGNTSGYYTYFQDGDLYCMIYRGWQHDEQHEGRTQGSRVLCRKPGRYSLDEAQTWVYSSGTVPRRTTSSG